MTDEKSRPEQIGGPVCKAPLEPGLLSSAGQELTPYERDALWRIFQEIGKAWKDLHKSAPDSENLKSSWLDFILAKTDSEPSFTAEYSNAVLCVDELIDEHGEREAFRLLFFENHIVDPENPDAPPKTRLAHAKKYVIDEFIRVNVVASGFKSFGEKGTRNRNYKGYLGGSRYNLESPVRDYEPESSETA